MKAIFCAAALLVSGVLAAPAQFSTRWLQDDAYWGDGKAEFNIYEAKEVRYGQPRESEVTHILVREPFAPGELVKTENGAQRGAYPVLKLNQVLRVPTGIYVYQQMHSAFWRVDSGALIKATLTSNDSCGNTYKEFRALTGPRTWLGGGWTYEWRTYWEGMSAGKETIRAPQDAIFYDELPMRVRTIDFAKVEATWRSPNPPGGEFDISLAPTIIGSKKGETAFVRARVKWVVADDETYGVYVLRGPRSETVDLFIVERAPPHRLAKWERADGGSLTLKRSLKIDYWNYNKLGDKERALSAAPE